MENYKYQQKQDLFQGESNRNWKRRRTKYLEYFYKKNNKLIDKYFWNSLSFDEKNLFTLRISKYRSIECVINDMRHEKVSIIRENKIIDILNEGF